MGEPVRVTRERLYEMVWAKPMNKLAAELGVTSAVVVRTCAVLNVPRPPQGHWQRLALGQNPPREPLPAPESDTPRESAMAGAREVSRAEAPHVVVQSTMRAPHPLVRKLEASLSPSRYDLKDVKRIRGSGHAVLRVSGETQRRAMLILDALFKAVRDRGHDVQLRDSGSRALEVVTKAGEWVEFWVIEPMDRSDHVLNDKERADKQRTGYSWAPTYDYAGSGRLVLEASAPWGCTLRHKWADGSRQRLEDLLGEIVVGLEALAVAWREDNRRRDLEHRAEEERYRKQEVERLAVVHDEALTKDLVRMARAWTDAQAVRGFLAALAVKLPECDRSNGFQAWFAWAEQCAQKLDPLHDPNSIAKRLEPGPQ